VLEVLLVMADRREHVDAGAVAQRPRAAHALARDRDPSLELLRREGRMRLGGEQRDLVGEPLVAFQQR
jgi:hypothetical protein